MTRKQQILLFSLLLIVKRLDGYLISSNESYWDAMLFFHPNYMLNNPGLDPNVPCNSNEPCKPYNATCHSVYQKCVCFRNWEFDNLGICIECPMENHICGFNECCGSDNLVCYYGLCKPCVRDTNTGRCITKEQLMYTTLSQISLALAMVLGILALITLLYKTCKRPNTMFGHSQRLGGRTGISIIDDPTRQSITSTQRRVLNQLRDRPPRYEREPSTANRNTNLPPHVLGEPPPLYTEVSRETENQQQTLPELPPAYSEEFPTISTIIRLTIEKDEDPSTSSTENISTTENVEKEEEKPPESPATQEELKNEEIIIER
ncbi:uncharacterized protein LOC134834764 [Culicoides brevitarsis]|uniref:uncharacterized protein LOC134834764 n=1 Tax=Culicoides brevitarsis TaxID=469753 RepID=UPI00307B206C